MRTPQHRRGGKNVLLFSDAQVTDPITPAGGPATLRPSVYGSPIVVYDGSLNNARREYRRLSTLGLPIDILLPAACYDQPRAGSSPPVQNHHYRKLVRQLSSASYPSMLTSSSSSSSRAAVAVSWPAAVRWPWPLLRTPTACSAGLAFHFPHLRSALSTLP